MISSPLDTPLTLSRGIVKILGCAYRKPRSPYRRVRWILSSVLCLLTSFIVPTQVRGEVTEAQVQNVAVELACLCGDCPTRPLDECRCGFAGTQRGRIADKLDEGKTKDQIIAGFVAEFGQRIFVTPPKEGFNLLAWFMPFFAILVGGYAVRSIMKGWSRTHAGGGQRTPTSPTSVSDTDRSKLEDALKERDT